MSVFLYPFAWILRMLYLLVQNYGIALILFSLVIKFILLPLNMKSKRSMMKTSRLTPKLKALEQKYYKISGEKAPDTTNYDEVRVKCVDAASVAAVQQAITDMGFQCSSMEDTRKYFDEQLTMIQTMLGGLAAISLFVAAIGIANTMVMSIYERTKEIGVMKVLGAELGAIRAMFLTESAMIGLIGGVVGVGLSFLISYLLNNVPIVANLLASLGLSFGNGGAVSIIPWWLVLLAMVFSMMVGVVFGFIPANRAVKISALEAIRHD